MGRRPPPPSPPPSSPDIDAKGCDDAPLKLVQKASKVPCCREDGKEGQEVRGGVPGERLDVLASCMQFAGETRGFGWGGGAGTMHRSYEKLSL